MKVYEILKESVAPEISAAFPKSFINKVYKVYNLDAHQLPEYLKTKPTLDTIKDGVVLSQGKDGKFAAVGFLRDQWSFKGNGKVGLITSDQPEGHIFKMTGTKAEAFKQFPAGKYFFLKYRHGTFERTRGEEKGNRISGNNSEKSSEILEYMNKTFGPKLKTQVEGYLDDIFANLRKLKTVKKSTFGSTERDVAMDAAKALEDLIADGFNRETMEEWLRANNASAYGSWGSIPTNYANFVELMSEEPNARAKFAKMVFSRAKQLHQSVRDMLDKKDEE